MFYILKIRLISLLIFFCGDRFTATVVLKKNGITRIKIETPETLKTHKIQQRNI